MRLIKWTTWVLFPLAVLLLATWLVSGFKPYYHYQFEKNQISQVTGIEADDLRGVIDRLSGYVVGRYETLNQVVVIKGQDELIYGEREVRHMVDVRHLFDLLRGFVMAYGVLLVVASLYEGHKGRGKAYGLYLSAYGLWGTIVLIASLGIMVVLDFSKYFVIFHELLFTNDMWLLDPRTDVLIQMLPESFFMETALVILGLSGTFIVLFYLGNKAFNRHVKE